LGALVAASIFGAPANARYLYGEAVAIDGDTLRIDETTIRLFGIDAPETAQDCPAVGGSEWACGEAASARLADLLDLGPVACEGDEVDDFGRLLAVCDSYDGTPINAALVSDGFAWAFVRYSAAYLVEEAQARSAGIGIWQAPTTPAWDYRAEERNRAVVNQPAPPSECVIKGNINRDGDRIYHLPGWPSYADTVIRIEDGERWFCTEQEAEAAGWRPPSRS